MIHPTVMSLSKVNSETCYQETLTHQTSLNFITSLSDLKVAFVPYVFHPDSTSTSHTL